MFMSSRSQVSDLWKTDKAIDEIETSGFNPAMFMSSRSQVSDCYRKETKL